MPEDTRLDRLSRELFLAAAGPGPGFLPAWAVDRMAALLSEEDVREGQTLYAVGDPPRYIYFLRDGRIRLAREGGGALVYEGRWVIGTFDILLERPRNRTAVALSSFRVLRAPGEGWLELLEDSFEVAQAMVWAFAGNVARLEEAYGVRDPVSHDVILRVMQLPESKLNLVERLTLLMELPLLRGAGVQTLADLAAVTEEAAFAPGETVLTRGGTGKERLYFVIDGDLEARNGPDRVSRFGPGTLLLGASAFGEAALPWEVRASEKARLLSFRIEDWVDLMEEHFDMVRSALTTFALSREQIVERLASERGELVLSDMGRAPG
jgi:CRP-like cAMP-binding protein